MRRWFLLLSLAAQACAHDPRFHVRPLAEVKAEAQRAAKGILVEFTADWCGPCKRFEDQLSHDALVQDALTEVILVRYDVERSWGEDDYRREFGFHGRLPLFVAVDPDGEVRGRYLGLPQAPEICAEVIRQAGLLSAPKRRIDALELSAGDDPETLLWIGRWYATRDLDAEANQRYAQALALPNLSERLRKALHRAQAKLD